MAYNAQFKIDPENFRETAIARGISIEAKLQIETVDKFLPSIMGAESPLIDRACRRTAINFRSALSPSDGTQCCSVHNICVYSLSAKWGKFLQTLKVCQLPSGGRTLGNSVEMCC